METIFHVSYKARIWNKNNQQTHLERNYLIRI